MTAPTAQVDTWLRRAISTFYDMKLHDVKTVNNRVKERHVKMHRVFDAAQLMYRS